MKWDSLTAACRDYPGFASMETFFSTCPKLIRNYLNLEKAAPGQLLIETDSPCSTVYILLSGRLHVIEEKAGEVPYSFYDLVPFDIIGDYELFSGDAESFASIQAREASVYLTLPASLYLSWIRDDSTALFFRTRLLMSQLSRQLKISRSLLFVSHELRCMYILCREAPLAFDGQNLCSLKLNRETLAARTGCSLRTIHRILRTLEERSLLSLSGARILITKKQLDAMTAALSLHGL